jgi:superfamily II DNA helicase RecQ
MQLKLFMLPVKNFTAAEGEMNAFLRSHRVLTVKKEFVGDGDNSFWTFCVEYLESAPGATGGNSLSGRPKVDYKEVLKPEEFEVFSRLREWRKGVAEKEGVPVYVVFSNEQLAQAVQKKVSSKAALKEIEGVGDSRVEKYGAAVLERLVFNPVPG